NHDDEAIAMHALNHPHSRHYCESVWAVRPEKVTGGRAVDLAWFSPDCKHFSSAKGGKPVEKKIRGLAWVVVRWAKTVKPRVIMLENVREFLTWGPLVPKIGADGQQTQNAKGELEWIPCPRRKGIIFKRWVGTLRNLGYAVEYKVLDAADFGAPTHRKRLFLIARRDKQPIVWPEPTHGPGRPNKYRTAAECIDWSIPCPSIFLSPAEAKTLGVRRPLKPNTLRRVAKGIEKYVLNAIKPFVVRVDHGGDHFRGQNAERPLSTITGAHGFAVTAPLLTAQYGNAPHQETRGQAVDEPIRTVTPRTGGGFSLVAPILGNHHGDRPDGSVRTGSSADDPFPTITGRSTQNSLEVAHLTKFFGGVVGQDASRPAPTVTAVDHTGVVTAAISQYNGQSVGQQAEHCVSSAILAGVGGRAGQSDPRSVERPAGTTTAKADVAVAMPTLFRMGYGDVQSHSADEPLRTIAASGNHHGIGMVKTGVAVDRSEEVKAFLTKYNGTAVGQNLREPLHTITPHDRFGLVWVRGVLYRIIDIGLRMLTPRELYRCQGFPETYVIDPVVNGRRLQKDAQVRMVGNSVCPQMSEALARANFPEAVSAPGSSRRYRKTGARSAS
ncbi:MAG: DNA cytosine methyltransferase, partial [Patescibacteria group bacterium]|nr:DNA cytosine methyltransferase [Patescibacteria group bacterium]